MRCGETQGEGPFKALSGGLPETKNQSRKVHRHTTGCDNIIIIFGANEAPQLQSLGGFYYDTLVDLNPGA